ncbi:hypothetical protein LTR35_011100 [Friedmanniomyces endolithicus]|uniref:Uncharacterized protein n=1 Tax=Friedmanniomyces endolithicus TaxID=329885 RepID=A0AAN6FVT6_9PEZI|nr:hypothetical protein LTR35_011100 [Friedmanniomyces endolithicus]KAK0277295.1 hypothetical protein LTS00_014268 [Friedmanniomyces endolithicus]KAK0323727.1 hypothetical protein LTR82_005474 [Friedmanniomyces endolithicus]KAK1018995.1 hypothetical protein LTR54_000808 [Friedmanniomyces endolithicus]
MPYKRSHSPGVYEKMIRVEPTPSRFLRPSIRDARLKQDSSWRGRGGLYYSRRPRCRMRCGGTAGSSGPKLVILMIEGGENNASNPLVENPALLPQHLVPASKTAVWYKANKSEQLDGREYMLPTGGLLGGGSSVNIMLSVVDGDY